MRDAIFISSFIISIENKKILLKYETSARRLVKLSCILTPYRVTITVLVICSVASRPSERGVSYILCISELMAAVLW